MIVEERFRSWKTIRGTYLCHHVYTLMAPSQHFGSFHSINIA